MNINLRNVPDDLGLKLKVAAIKQGVPFHRFIIRILEKVSEKPFIKRRRGMIKP